MKAAKMLRIAGWLGLAWLLAVPLWAEENLPVSIEPVAEEADAAYPVSIVPAEQDPEYQGFDDVPMLRNIEYPDWFKPSFLNLPEDLAEAVGNGKLGIILYFTQAHCAYCEAMIEANFNQPATAAYIQKYFDMIAVDVWGELPLVTLAGEKTTETGFADREQTAFTPSLIFYGKQGQEILRVRGYYPPYIFRAMLDYVISGSYQKGGRFQDYLARSKTQESGGAPGLHDDPLFSAPPYYLARQPVPAERMLAVLFEQPQCHACDILHNELLTDPLIRNQFSQMEVVRLDAGQDTPLLTPAGKATTARAWAGELGVFYSPSLLFFDEQGREVLRVDSVVRLFRLKHVLDYVIERGYLEEPLFLRWISRRLSVEEE